MHFHMLCRSYKDSVTSTVIVCKKKQTNRRRGFKRSYKNQQNSSTTAVPRTASMRSRVLTQSISRAVTPGTGEWVKRPEPEAQ